MFEISKATFSDVDTICKLGAQTFTEAYAAFNTEADLEDYTSRYFSKEKIEEELKSAKTGYYLCFHGPKAIGYLKLNFNIPCEAFASEKATELQRIYVLKEYYRQKAGHALMHHAFELSKEFSSEYLWLGVWKENHRALKFYTSCGFETIGERTFRLGTKIYEDYYLRKRV
ncbi:MAG: GNAT family N-acetyltransferase [Bacteroidetes bacterium]|nr:GNAT family N-acetyltransferase [Bacteroidota bacterium]